MAEQKLHIRERIELCDLFLSLGPDAPTLCEGWTTADLAAHLVVREHDPRSAPGIMSERFAGYTKKLQDAAKAKGFERNVERIRTGPPLLPWRLPGLETLFNLNEYFVHHEDVRRANGQTRRTDRPDLDDALWEFTKKSGKLVAGRVKPAGLTLARPNGTSYVLRASDPANMVTITGEPSEISLFLVGRRTAAVVTIEGDPVPVAIVEKAKLGI
jgi:uncharacterized protein (TIGR03085 family)